ncbi:MAG TPA: hypothetical protein VN605_02490, partial [Thermoanaerobaculia bacterium]|nr:hypothetical protein [Thermoanaerobaculia bacterium]
HYVRFEKAIWTVGGNTVMQLPYKERVRELDLAGFNNTRAKYTFNYKNGQILRDAEHTTFDGEQEVPFNSDGTINVPLLQSIVMPAADSGHGSGAEKWTFDYIETPGSGPGDYVPVSLPWRPAAASLRMGRLNQIGLPTGGAIHYEYGRYRFPRRRCDEVSRNNASHPGLHLQSPRWSTTVGVKQRQNLIRNAGGALVAAERPTLYFSDVNIPEDTFAPEFCGALTRPDDFYNIRVDPDGTITKLFFSAFLGFGATGIFDPMDYGLPLSKLYPDPTQPANTPDPARRYISSQVFDCSADLSSHLVFLGEDDSTYWSERNMVTNAITNPPSSNGCKKVRSTYVRFERSGVPCGGADFISGNCAASNRRLASQSTIYEDEPSTVAGNPVFRVEDYTDFDGVGHFRHAIVDGAFAREAGAGSDRRETTTNYNPGLSIASPFETVPWLFQTYSFKLDQTSGAAGPQASLTSFDWDSGFATRTRTHNSPALVNGQPPPAAPADVVVDFARSPAPGASPPATGTPIVVTETHSGGDADAIHGQRKQYILRKEYLYGLRSRTEYRTDATTAFLLASATNVDRNTGLPALDYDASSASTTYTFDGRGRLTSVAP